MANGARVVIKDLVAGYANIPTNILKGHALGSLRKGVGGRGLVTDRAKLEL